MTSSFPFAAAKRHFAQRVSYTAAMVQAPGIMVHVGSMRVQQQTFVKNALRIGGGSGIPEMQGAHIVAGGIYVVHRPGDPRFNDLYRNGGYNERLGCVTTTLADAAMSSQGRQLIETQLAATNILPTVVNRIDLAAEGTRGNQPMLTAGEKSALEKAVSMVKTSAPGRTLKTLVNLAITETIQVCGAVAQRLLIRDAELKVEQARAKGAEKSDIELKRELLRLKVDVLRSPSSHIDEGALVREAELLASYEAAAMLESKSSV